MTEYIVGLRHGKRSEVLTIEAEDALVAALKAKHNHTEALISYIRKSNRRGDHRNPHRQNEGSDGRVVPSPLQNPALL
jgi:hypothetical protein